MKIENISPRQLFLIDSLGALVSAVMLGLVLASFENVFGMPKETLHLLAGLAVVFCVYSFTCYSTQPKNWRFFMKIIAIVNLLYCCLTIGCMIFLHEKLTILGYAYFIGEILVIIVLARFELKMSK